MKLKTTNYMIIIAVLLLATLIIAGGAISGQSSPVLPLPPTPGPAPTWAPDAYISEGTPITSRDQAVQRALLLDSAWTAREQPLTEEVITANPNMITVEHYATRQEASNVYRWGDFPEPEVASEPVWVVIIKGKVAVRVLGGFPPVFTRDEKAAFTGWEEADGVIYCFSQETGLLLSLTAGTEQK